MQPMVSRGLGRPYDLTSGAFISALGQDITERGRGRVSAPYMERARAGVPKRIGHLYFPTLPESV